MNTLSRLNFDDYILYVTKSWGLEHHYEYLTREHVFTRAKSVNLELESEKGFAEATLRLFSKEYDCVRIHSSEFSFKTPLEICNIIHDACVKGGILS